MFLLAPLPPPAFYRFVVVINLSDRSTTCTDYSNTKNRPLEFYPNPNAGDVEKEVSSVMARCWNYYQVILVLAVDGVFIPVRWWAMDGNSVMGNCDALQFLNLSCGSA